MVPLTNTSRNCQQFPLSTAAMASYLYSALGGADARNEGGVATRNSPLRSPIA